MENLWKRPIFDLGWHQVTSASHRTATASLLRLWVGGCLWGAATTKLCELLCSVAALLHLLQVYQNHEAWGMASNKTCEVFFVEVPNLAVIVPWIRMPFSYLDLKKLLFSPRFVCFELPQPASFNLQSGDGDFFGRIFDREVWDQLKDFRTKRAHVIFCSLPITPSQSESLKTLSVGFEKPSKTNKDDLIISWMNDDWTRSFVQHGFFETLKEQRFDTIKGYKIFSSHQT